MARGGAKIKKRKEVGDPMYNSVVLAKGIRGVMRDGKKTVAQGVVYDAFEILKKEGHDALAIFEQAIETVGPKVEVKAKRIGGAAYQVPTEVRGVRKNALAIRWILDATRKRPTGEYKTFAQKLAAELLDATKNAGEAVRKRDVAHRMADANKAFAHFRY